MLVLPAAVAAPSPELLITTLVLSEDVHVTVEVMSSILPSLYDPIAWNCCAAPIGIVTVCGDTVIEDKAYAWPLNLTDNGEV